MSDDRLTLVLCDYAEVVNGKLYLMGGGITAVRVVGNYPIMLSVGVIIRIPWQETNQKHKMNLRLLTEDGQEIPSPDGSPFGAEGELEVGRPPGVRPGSDIPVALAFRMPPMSLPTGRYGFEMHLDGSLEGTLPFDVHN